METTPPRVEALAKLGVELANVPSLSNRMRTGEDICAWSLFCNTQMSHWHGSLQNTIPEMELRNSRVIPESHWYICCKHPKANVKFRDAQAQSGPLTFLHSDLLITYSQKSPSPEPVLTTHWSCATGILKRK